ncbi:MAG: GNAT family protein [Bryobacteraceae bacterium]
MELRRELPLKPDAVILRGNWVELAPLDPLEHTPDLYAVSNGQPARLGERSIEAYDSDALIWAYMGYGPFAGLDEFRDYLRSLTAPANQFAFCVTDLISGKPAGVTTLMSNAPEHLKIEVGHIWYTPLVQRTAANTEATYLMLRHCFELGYRRLEWKCNALNERSRRAALRMGFRFEGIQEAHMILKGRNRDTAWFRILAPEWPDVKQKLEEMLRPAL